MIHLLASILLWWTAMFGPRLEACTIVHYDNLTPAQHEALSHLTYDFPAQVPVLLGNAAYSVNRSGLDCRLTRTIHEDEVIVR